mgnify:CR=1 FL=1
MEWSTQDAAPTTNGMLLEEFTQWYQQTHGIRSMPAFRKLIKRAQKTGSSWEGQSLEHILSVNRAGDGFPGNISKTQIIRKYCPSSPTMVTTRIDTLLIPDVGRIYKFRAPVGPFDKGLETLARDNYDLVSAYELIRSRLLCNGARDGALETQHRVEKVNNGTWVAEGIVYFPDGDMLIVDKTYNPILRASSAATKLHMNGKECVLSSATAKLLLDKSVTENSDLVFPSILRIRRKKFDNHIPSNAFSQHPLPRFLFSVLARNYSKELLLPAGILSVPVEVCSLDYVRAQKKPFVRALWIDGPNTGATISGNGHPLSDYYGRVSGLQIKS